MAKSSQRVSGAAREPATTGRLASTQFAERLHESRARIVAEGAEPLGWDGVAAELSERRTHVAT